jgi:hypothetical protein
MNLPALKGNPKGRDMALSDEDSARPRFGCKKLVNCGVFFIGVANFNRP